MAGLYDRLFNSWMNVTSDYRNEVVFADRNKAYGAYQLRKTYNRFYSLSLLITVGMAIVGFGVPKLVSMFKAQMEKVENVDIQLTDMEPPPVDKNEPEPPPPPPPPPPPAQEMVKFIPPVVVDEPIVEEVVTQEELKETQAGEKTQEGTGDDVVIIPDEGTGDQVIDQPKEVEPFISVEQVPEFVGGEGAMMKFIAENLEYPQAAKDNSIEGRVHLKFTVTADGSIKDIVVLNKDKLGYGCEQAAIAVIQKMPKWKPGRQNGQPVPVYFNIPIRFRLF
jgi:protein TonB